MAQLNSLLVTGDSRFLNPINGNARNGIYYVKGTQTAATGAWTGVIPVPALYDGLTICYYLPYAGSGNATLNLTLSTGATTGAKNCYYNTGRLTTHYGKGQNVFMTYHPAGSISIDGVATADDRWVVAADYVDGNSIGYIVTNYYNRFKVGSNKVFPYTIIMQCADGRWESLVTSSSTATTKTRNTHGFRLGQLAFVNANNTYNENANISDGNVLCEHKTDLIDHRYSFNTANDSTNGLTASTPVYLVGTLNTTDGLFYLDTKWWTQTLPSSEDGKLYIYLGDAFDYYRMTFRLQHPIYHYLNGAIREYTQSATTTVAQRQKDSGNVNFPVLFANDNVGVETDQVNAVFKSKKVYINPETGNLNATQLNGTTIPASPKFTDTDTKVRQTLSTTNKNYPLLLSYAESSSTTANIDNVSYRNNSIYANPSTGTITATKLVGDISGGTGMTSSQVTGALGYTPYNSTNPNGYEANQNAFSNVKVGSTTVAADSKTDTLELAAGDNVTLTPDATNDKVTIAAANDKVTQTYATTGDNAYLLLSGSVSASTTTEGVRKTGLLSQRMSDYKASSYGGWESDTTTDGYKKIGLLNHDGLFVTMAPGNNITNIITEIKTDYGMVYPDPGDPYPELHLSFSSYDSTNEERHFGSISSSSVSLQKLENNLFTSGATLTSSYLQLNNNDNLFTMITPGIITTGKVICDKMSVSSKTNVTFSKTSGVQTSANDAFFRRSGNVVQLNIYFKGNGSSTAVGTTVIEGTFSSNLPAPSEATRLIGYYSSTHFMGTLYTNRTFQLRLLGAAVNISTSNTVLLSGTYITDET